MKKEIVLELGAADPQTFNGNAFSCLVAAAEHDVPIKIYYVRFEPGARTNWHAHSGRQILIVSSGRCRYQIADEPVREIGVGESVSFDPGVRHWHGAVDGGPAEHVAVNLDNRETNWMDAVTDGEYRGPDSAG